MCCVFHCSQNMPLWTVKLSDVLIIWNYFLNGSVSSSSISRQGVLIHLWDSYCLGCSHTTSQCGCGVQWSDLCEAICAFRVLSSHSSHMRHKSYFHKQPQPAGQAQLCSSLCGNSAAELQLQWAERIRFPRNPSAVFPSLSQHKPWVRVESVVPE